ncbi:MAG TPA: hypothetical protein VJ792_02210 [Candidatus Nitrosotalea sp.]|nr:hypothetical protein [Candidatus Nitrosotalea sp.]
MNYHISSASPRVERKGMAALAFSAILLLALGMPHSWAQEDQSITLNTTKSYYGPGDTVYLTGAVSGGTPGQLVAVQVKDLKGNLILIRTVQADQNGNFGLSFKIPAAETSGDLNITASARVSGFPITQSKIISTPVPEFPSAGPAFAAGIASIVAFFAVMSGRASRTRLSK